jgi:hypothetical protein
VDLRELHLFARELHRSSRCDDAMLKLPGRDPSATAAAQVVPRLGRDLFLVAYERKGASMRVLASAALVLLGMSGLSGQEQTFEVKSGYHEGPAIRFQPALDWEALTPDEVRTVPIPTADAAIVARYSPLIDMYGSAEVITSTPVPGNLAGRNHYFLGTGGVGRLQLDSAEAVTRLRFNGQQTAVVGRISYGELYGSVSDRPTDAGGGFVLSSEAALRFDAQPSTFTADDLLTGSQAVEQTPDGYHGRGTTFWNIVAQYRFTVDSAQDEWLFVQWAPDRELFEIGCEYRYSLFRLAYDDQPPVQVAWTSYGCDV